MCISCIPDSNTSACFISPCANEDSEKEVRWALRPRKEQVGKRSFEDLSLMWSSNSKSEWLGPSQQEESEDHREGAEISFSYAHSFMFNCYSLIYSCEAFSDYLIYNCDTQSVIPPFIFFSIALAFECIVYFSQFISISTQI